MSFILDVIFVSQLIYFTVLQTSFAEHSDYSFTQTNYQPKKKCQPATVPKYYTVVPGIGAYKVHTEAAVWNEAENICESEGAYLAVINSEDEAAAILRIISAAGRYSNSYDPNYTLIGFRYDHQQRDFVTIFGSRLKDAGFFTWSPNEPNNHNNREYCGSVHNTDGLLNDLNCNLLYGYICELSASRLAW